MSILWTSSIQQKHDSFKQMSLVKLGITEPETCNYKANYAIAQ